MKDLSTLQYMPRVSTTVYIVILSVSAAKRLGCSYLVHQTRAARSRRWEGVLTKNYDIWTTYGIYVHLHPYRLFVFASQNSSSCRFLFFTLIYHRIPGLH
jgi:hypothetical protein